MKSLFCATAAACMCIAYVPLHADAQSDDSTLYCIISPEGASYAAPAGVTVWTRFRMGTEEAVIVAAPLSMDDRFAPAGGRCIAVGEPGLGEELYLVAWREGLDLELLDRSASVLAQGGRTALVIAAEEAVEKFAAAGMRIRAILPPRRTMPARVQPVPDPGKRAGHADLIQEIMDRITVGNVSDMIGNLSGVNGVTIGGAPYTIQTRNSYQTDAIRKATQFAYEHFQALGLEAKYHEYVWHDNSWRNVYAVQTGTVNPDSAVIICGHLDDMPVGSIAPGADDNASGSTAVLLASSALKDYRFENTIVYVLFTGEEQGLIGSQSFANALTGTGRNVIGALNFDMISWNYNGENGAEVYCGTMAQSGIIADSMLTVMGEYSLPLYATKLTEDVNWSDQYSFWDAGYPAIVGIEAGSDYNPNYHEVTDTLEICDPTYSTNVMKAAVGTLARLGVPAGTAPGAQAEIALNGTSFAAGDFLSSRFVLNRSIARAFTAYAVIFLPDGSMVDAMTLGAVTPVASSVPGLAAGYTCPLLSIEVPAGAPPGSCEMVAAFFDPNGPITGRGGAFLQASAPFTIR